MTFAAWMKSVRRYLLPRFEMRPRIGSAAGAVLPRHEAEPGAEIAPALESLARADRGHHGSGDHRPDAGHAHQPLAVGLAVADLLDLAGERLDALVEPEPVLVEADNQIAHARRHLVGRFSNIAKSDLRRALRAGATRRSLAR